MSLAALGFAEIWVADYEFRAGSGETPVPVCLVAKELLSGRLVHQWADELGSTPPYSLAENSLFIAYYATAEFSCHLALEWSLPANVIDAYVEFRNLTNGRFLKCGSGLLGALAYFGEDAIDTLEKEAMRALVMRGGEYTAAERQAILAYCASDVVGLEQLVHHLARDWGDPVNLAQALQRGRYTKAVAHMEARGIPVDLPLLTMLRGNWDGLKQKLVAQVDAQYGVYEGNTFKHDRFAAYLVRSEIPWPRLPSGRLCLDDDTFSEQCKSYPQLRPLKDLRNALGQLRLNDLAVGPDGRNRCLLSMFKAKTGRNQPSTSKFVFGLAAWLRGLIRPEAGYGLAYIDWSQQEFAIAAALSGDLPMQRAYRSGDPYLAFAKQAGAAPATATKASHAAIREQFKACVLAVQYGMGEESLALRIGQPVVYARELLRLHRQTYRSFWAWSDGVVNYAQVHRRLWTVFGWRLQLEGKVNERSVRNFPMQANGAEMLRLACCLGSEAGIRMIAPVHDAILIEAPLDELERATAQMQQLMAEASTAVLAGFALRSDVKYIRAPERYADERGQLMWQTVMRLLETP